MVDYARVRMIVKFAHIAGAILLFVIAVIQFAQLNFSQMKFIMLIYYILFGILIILIELGFGAVLRYFYFMYYSWGKAVFAFFVATLIFTKDQWWQLASSIIFFIAAAGFIVLGFVYRSEEAEEAAKHLPPPKEGEAAAQPAQAPATQDQKPADITPADNNPNDRPKPAPYV